MVARLRTGDQAAFGALYDQYAETLHQIGFMVLGDADDAEDLVHDVFVGLPRALETFEARGSFEGWLKRVAWRAALMKLRQTRARRRFVDRHGWLFRRHQSAPSVEAGLDLEHALRRLDPKYRAVFLLREVEGYSYADVADILGIRVGAAKVRLFRARRALRAILKEY